MIMKKWEIKRFVDSPKFVVITCCQGQPFYRLYKSLLGGLIGYTIQYLKMNKHETNNISLKEAKIYELVGEEVRE